jgi:hypothetical protein
MPAPIASLDFARNLNITLKKKYRLGDAIEYNKPQNHQMKK